MTQTAFCFFTLLFALSGVSSFTTPTLLQRSATCGSSLRTCSHRLAATSDAQAMLEKARKLKAEAEAAENELHKNLLEKKTIQNKELDSNIEKLFPKNDDSVNKVVERLKASHWSTDRLMQIVERLHEREITAQGKGRVTASMQGERTQFDRVSEGNQEELERVRGLVDKLIDAADLIDEEFMKKKRNAKDSIYLNHSELDHWTIGELAKNLRGKVRELRREHEDQFQERLESFYEAQRKKDLPKPGEDEKPKP